MRARTSSAADSDRRTGLIRIAGGGLLLLVAAIALLSALVLAGAPVVQVSASGLPGTLIGAGVFTTAGALLIRSGRARRRRASEDLTHIAWCGTEAVNAQAAAADRLRRPRRASIFSNGRLFVDVEQQTNGDLVFLGQDRAYPFGDDEDTEYEYSLTVRAADTELLRQALGGGHEDDLIDLLVPKGAAIVQQGEQRWLRSLGIEPELWSWVGW